MVLTDSGDDDHSEFIQGMIKKPSETARGGLSLFEMDGILPNFLLVIIHFVIIFGIPLIVPAFVFLAMSAMTTF
jgi:hypothetical protein